MAQPSDQADTKQDAPGPAADIPLGPLQGKFYGQQQYSNLGQNRPLGPGEYVALPDGSWANEMTYTVPYQNQFAVVPGLWLMNGVPHRVDEDQAAQLAQQSGLNWPMFANQEAAEQYSNTREAGWEKAPHGRSDWYPPLWSRQWPPAQKQTQQKQGQ